MQKLTDNEIKKMEECHGQRKGSVVDLGWDVSHPDSRDLIWLPSCCSTCGDLRVRPWRKDDLDALLRHANNPKIASNLRDQFPHPYTRRDASRLLELRAGDGTPISRSRLEHEGEAVGGIGFQIGDRHCAAQRRDGLLARRNDRDVGS